MKISPKQYGLPARTVLEQVDDATIAIVVDRKSRIGMADGKNILKKAKKIKLSHPVLQVILQTTAPVCSKTITFLENENISVQSYPVASGTDHPG